MDKKPWPSGISADGAGLRIRIWDRGKLIYSETLKGDPYSTSLIAAAKNRRQWLTARQKLGLPLYEGDETEVQSFEYVAQDYMNTLDAKYSTHMSYENILNHYWLTHYTGWPVEDITIADIKRKLASFNVSGKTKKNILIPLRGVLALAEINPNPVDAIKVKRGQKAPVLRYTPRERKALLEALDGQEAVYFALLFGCGLRPCGEPLALQWTDYDGEELEISKQITKRRIEPSTKTNVRRKVYVPQWVRPYLNNHYTRFDGGYIFQNTLGRPHLDSDVFNRAWRKAHKRARLPYRIPYTCRHTRASELLSIGVEPADAAKQMGHSVEMFFRIYADRIEEFTNKRDKNRFEGFTAESTDETWGKNKNIE